MLDPAVGFIAKAEGKALKEVLMESGAPETANFSMTQ